MRIQTLALAITAGCAAAAPIDPPLLATTPPSTHSQDVGNTTSSRFTLSAERSSWAFQAGSNNFPGSTDVSVSLGPKLTFRNRRIQYPVSNGGFDIVSGKSQIVASVEYDRHMFHARCGMSVSDAAGRLLYYVDQPRCALAPLRSTFELKVCSTRRCAGAQSTVVLGSGSYTRQSPVAMRSIFALDRLELFHHPPAAQADAEEPATPVNAASAAATAPGRAPVAAVVAHGRRSLWRREWTVRTDPEPRPPGAPGGPPKRTVADPLLASAIIVRNHFYTRSAAQDENGHAYGVDTRSALLNLLIITLPLAVAMVVLARLGVTCPRSESHSAGSGSGLKHLAKLSQWA